MLRARRWQSGVVVVGRQDEAKTFAADVREAVKGWATAKPSCKNFWTSLR